MKRDLKMLMVLKKLLLLVILAKGGNQELVLHLRVNQVLSRKPDALNTILTVTPIILILSLVLVPTKQKHLI